MIRSERHLIKKSNPNWIVCDDFCFKAKNLYNTVNFILKQALLWKNNNDKTAKDKIIDFIDLVNDKGYIRKYDLIKHFTKLKHSDFYAISTQSARYIVTEIYSLYKGAFTTIRNKKIKHKVSLPRYKHKQKGRVVYTFTNQNSGIKNGEFYYSLSKGLKFHGIKVQHHNYQTVSIVPNIDGTYTLVITYKIPDCIKRTSGSTLSIDLGVNTLMAITSDKGDYRPVLVNGRPLKSLNRYWQLLIAKAQSKLPRGKNKRYISEYIYSLNRKRNNKMKDALHKISKWLIRHAIENGVYRIIIGYNKNQKYKCSMHGKSKQDFIQIPRLQLVQMIQYKADDVGIDVILHEESYTSVCSALDREKIREHKTYCGKRDDKNKGKFTTANGTIIHADVNGSLNIMRKVIGDDFLNLLDIGCVLQPKKLTIWK